MAHRTITINTRIGEDQVSFRHDIRRWVVLLHEQVTGATEAETIEKAEAKLAAYHKVSREMESPEDKELRLKGVRGGA